MFRKSSLSRTEAERSGTFELSKLQPVEAGLDSPNSAETYLVEGGTWGLSNIT